jgi:hypothetical protein
MSDNSSRDLVEQFLLELRRCLAFHHASLVEVDDHPPLVIEPRFFDIPEAPLPAKLLVHRTLRTQHLPTPEYRARIVVSLPEDQRAMIARRRQDANRLSMLGAIDPEGKQIWSQGLIHLDTMPVLGAVTAVALMNSGTSLLEALRRTSRPSFRDLLRGDFRRPPQPRTPSAWSDLDMERLHFDHAHLPGSLKAGIWRLPIASGELSLGPIDDYPLLGGGLLLHLQMPREIFIVGARKVSAGELNTISHYLSDAPCFGSWSEDASVYSFRCFAPNSVETVLHLADHYLGWGLLLARQARALAEHYPSLAVYR